MPELVALDLAAGPGFLEALEAVWEDGNAVLPLDPRLPDPAKQRLVVAFRPSAVVDRDGTHVQAASRPVEIGDALVVATSGTRGDPKGVVLTHDAVGASARATSLALQVDPGRDHWLACLPLAHIGGLSVVTRAILTGTPLTVLERFDAAAVEAAARDGATLVSLVSTALGRVDASRFRAILLGGSAPPDTVPSNVVTTYGLTETGSGIVYDGRPLDEVDLRIGDGALGQPGEVLVRGPMLLRAYRDGSDPKIAGEWLPTGDGGSLASDGTLSVFGRIAEVIVTGGEKVWPTPVEEALSRHPSIEQVAVWKRPDPEWGERVVAWVVLRDPSSPPRLDELRDLVAESLGRWSAPREIVVVEALPRTASGKVRRSALE
jgi:O-succinylbenzoic acid--CoA ligase